MNVYDSERLAGVLAAAGYAATDTPYDAEAQRAGVNITTSAIWNSGAPTRLPADATP